MAEKIAFYTISVITFLALFYARIHLLNDIGFFDYDSANNFNIIYSTYSGNYDALFHHASPLFYLIHGFFFSLTPIDFTHVYFSSLINVIAIFILVGFIKKQLSLSKLNYIILLLFCGTSTFLVVSSAYLAIESLSLLFFVLCFKSYHKSKSDQSFHLKYSLLTAFYFILLLGINYKAILLIPIFLVVELFFKKIVFTPKTLRVKIFFTLKKASITLIVFLVGTLFYSILGLFLGHDFLSYAKYFYVVAFIKDVNQNVDVPSFNWDLLFYVKYLFEYENFLLWVGFIIALFKWKSITKLFTSNSKKDNLLVSILIIIFCYLLGMSVLQKAPRGLLFIYPFLYLLSFLAIQKVAERKLLLILIMSIGIGYNINLILNHIYKYRTTAYPELNEVISNNNIDKIATTVGINASQFLDNVSLDPAFNLNQLNKLKNRGIKYCLVDNYYIATNTLEFDRLNKKNALIKLREPTLLNPYLFLEHAEFSGLSYSEVKALHQKALDQPYQLYLIKLED